MRPIPIHHLLPSSAASNLTSTPVKTLADLAETDKEAILNIYLIEFKELRAELRQYNDARQKLLNYAILALGGAATIAIGLDPSSETLGGLLLVLPIVFFAFLVASLGYSRLINVAANYSYDVLGKQINEIMGKLEPKPEHLLGWQTHFRRHATINSGMTGIGEFLTLAVPLVGDLVLYWLLGYPNRFQEGVYNVLFLVDCILVVIGLLLAVLSNKSLD